MMLVDFLKRECSNGASWNCSTMPADWCVALGYPDFAAEWRRVVEPSACDLIPLTAGGLVNLWDRGIGSSLPVVADLSSGDIAVVTLDGIDKGAIWTGESWAIRGSRTVHWIKAPLPVIRAWRP